MSLNHSHKPGFISHQRGDVPCSNSFNGWRSATAPGQQACGPLPRPTSRQGLVSKHHSGLLEPCLFWPLTQDQIAPGDSSWDKLAPTTHILVSLQQSNPSTMIRIRIVFIAEYVNTYMEGRVCESFPINV